MHERPYMEDRNSVAGQCPEQIDTVKHVQAP